MARPLAPTVRPYSVNKLAAAPPLRDVIAAAMLATAADLGGPGPGNRDALLGSRLCIYRCRLVISRLFEDDRFAIQPGECKIDHGGFFLF